MGSTGVSLALLLCFLGPLDAQTGAGFCHRPVLPNGYFVPEEESYGRGAQIIYTCEKGHKPAAEGWWGASLCQGGTWSPKLQCIDEGACLPPEIPNGAILPSAADWYQHGNKIRVTCDAGFEHQYFEATGLCENGSWSTVPVCTRRTGSCGEPPQVLNAVVINRGHQEVFPEDSLVQYQCKKGYVMKGGTDDQKSVYCIGGNWTQAPTCIGSCVLNAADHPRSTIQLSREERLREGEGRAFRCGSDGTTTVIVWCRAGKLTLSGCCSDYDRHWGYCT